MIIIYILILPVLIFCLFLFFTFARHDFVILRKNITLTRIFDNLFKSLVITLFIGRVFYIIHSGDFYLLNILAFFHFIQNPGFSILGGFIGLILSLIFFFRKTKIVLRILDITMLSFFPIVILNSFAVSYFKTSYVDFIVSLVLILLFGVFIRLNKSYTLKDGSLACIVAAFIAINSFFINFQTRNILTDYLSLTQWVSIAIFIASVTLFILIKTKKFPR